MGAQGAANVIFRREIAAERGLVDDVIGPAGARNVLIRSLEMLRHKHAPLPERKHGNSPM